MTAAVLFDLDETVLDRTASLKAFVQWQVDGMLRGQVACSKTFIQRFIELDNHGKVWKDKVYGQLVDEFSIEHWSAEDLLESYLLCFCGFSTPRTAIGGALEYLNARDIRMGIVTNGKSPFQERNVRTLARSEYFEITLVSDAVGIRKPDRRIFELACAKLDAKIELSIFVGDNPVADIQGAKQAGMKTIYVPVDDQAEACVYADSTVTDLQDLPGALEHLLNAVS